MSIPRIIITPGEPAGIGSDIVLQAAQKNWPAELIVVCDPDLLQERSQQLKIPIQLTELDFNEARSAHHPGTLKIIPVKLNTACKAGQLDPDNAAYVIKTLELATDICLRDQAHALVTGPVHKSVLNDAGIYFSGHTEFLAQRCNAPQSLMLFVVDTLKVALATTHIPLAAVPVTITQELLIHKLRL